MNPSDDVMHDDNLVVSSALEPFNEAQLVEGFDEMLFLMMRFTKQQLLKEVVDDTPITPPQFILLWCLSSECSQNMSEISEHMHLSQGAATGLVDRLSKLGLVERNRSTTDRRVVSIQITDEGRSLVERIHLRRRGILRNMLMRLTPDERQLLFKIDSMMKDMLKNHED